MLNTTELLKMAVEIAKAYAASAVNRGTPVEEVLEAVYKKLKELNEA